MIIKNLIFLTTNSFLLFVNSQSYDSYSYSADDEDLLPRLNSYNGGSGDGQNLPNYYDADNYNDNYGDRFAPIDEEVVRGEGGDYRGVGSGDYSDQDYDENDDNYGDNNNNQNNRNDYDPYGFSSNNKDEVITNYDNSSPVLPENDNKKITNNDNLLENNQEKDEIIEKDDYYDSNNYEDLPVDPIKPEEQPEEDNDDSDYDDQYDNSDNDSEIFYDEDNDDDVEKYNSDSDQNLTNFTDDYDDDDNFEILDENVIDDKTSDYEEKDDYDTNEERNKNPKIVEIASSIPGVSQVTIGGNSENDDDNPSIMTNNNNNPNDWLTNNPVINFFKDIFNFKFEGDFWSEKYFLAALLCGAFVGFLIIAIVIGFICHSIRKADEGSYIIDKTLRYNEEYTRDSLLQNAMNSNNRFQVQPGQTLGNQEYFA